MFEAVLVVRHAPAGDRTTWSGPDAARPLDDVGLSCALDLVRTLAHRRFDSLYSSPAVRCTHTLVAVAAQRRLGVHHVDWLAPGTTTERVAHGLGEIAQRGLRRPLLCSHRESIEPILAALVPGEVMSGLVELSEPLAKGSAIQLDFDAGHVVGAERIAASGVEANRWREVGPHNPTSRFPPGVSAAPTG